MRSAVGGNVTGLLIRRTQAPLLIAPQAHLCKYCTPFYAELPYESLDARIVEERRSPRCHSRFNNLASPNAFDVFVYVQIGVYFAICVAISRLSIYRLKTAQIWHTGSLLRAFLPVRVQKFSKDTAVSLAAAPSACYVTLR